MAIAVAAVIVLPLAITIWRLVVDERSLTFGAFADTWNEPGTVAMLRNTILMVGASTTFAVMIAATFAWLNERTDARIGWASETLPIVPFFVPPLAGAIGWVILAEPNVGLLNTGVRSIAGWVGLDLGSSGPIDIYSWYGLIFVTTLYLVPHAYLVIGSALQNLDPSLEEASRMSGAGHLRTLARVTLPAIRPSLISAVLLALVVGFALYSVPVLIAAGANIDILSVRIVRLMTRSFPPEMAEAVVLCLIMIVFIGTASFLQTRATRAGRHATIGGRFGGGAIIKLGVMRWPARAAVIAYLLASSVLPFVGLVLLSLQKFWSTDIAWSNLSLENYNNLFLSGAEFGDATKALRNSIVLGIVGATAAILIAALITYYIAARSQGMLSRAVNSIVKLPGALSHIVLALALIATLAGPPISLGGTLAILFIAYLVMYMPQASVTAGSAFFQVDRFLQEASRISGATEFRT
ncbi:MAG TPA: ABC transporter permease subunit, partial [Steroidobacter sp.]|nr:ABC transporter permease subunit [Steroidobacter sp.]